MILESAETTSGSDVFVSFASPDGTIANAIVESLEQNGLRCWIASRDVVPGSLYADGIVKAINDTRFFVLVLSEHALDSAHVGKELERASSKRHPIFAIRSDAAPLTRAFEYFLSESQWIDVGKGGIEAALAKLVSAMRNQASSNRAVSTSSQRDVPTHRTRRAYSVALLGFAVIGALVWYVMNYRGDLSRKSAGTASSVATDNAQLNTISFGDRPAIAVLPFENLSEDPKHALFADGLAEDLITRLSAWRAFPVIARGSSFHYRGDVNVRQAAKELGARYIVKGSVRQTTDRLRVNAQLVDAQTGAAIWSQSYDRPLADVFDLQDEISSAIAAPLVGDLARAEAHMALRRDPRNLDAWSAYLLGEQHLFKLTSDEVAVARSFFERAIAIEPQFASAYAGLADAYFWQWQFATVQSTETLDLALKSARRAVELDPLNADAYDALGLALLGEKDTHNGYAASGRAVELNPSLPMAWSNLAYAKLMFGDPKGTLEAVDRALRLSPSDPLAWSFHENASEAFWELGEFEAGLEHAQAMVAGNPDYFWGYIDVAMNAVGLGQLDLARDAIAKGRRMQTNLSLALIDERSGVTRPEIITRRAAALREAGLN